MAGQSNNPLAGYKYGAMSNLVLQADKRFTNRRAQEPAGDPESLAGRLTITDMGSRVMHTPAQKPKVAPNVVRGDAHQGEEVLERERRKRKRDAPTVDQLSFAGVDVEDLVYTPRTAATRETYNLLVIAIRRKLGDVSAQMAVSATDAVLETLKNTEMKDFDKKRDIDDLIGQSLGSKEYTDLVNLGKKLTDYGTQGGADGPNAKADEETDERGVAVEFQMSDDEEGSNYARSVQDQSDPEEDADHDVRMGDGDEEDDEEQEEPAVQSGTGGQERELTRGDTFVPAHEIDPFWIQRQLASAFDDAAERQVKAQEVAELLSKQPESEEDDILREVENSLMELFDFEHNDIVARLVANKDRIHWISAWRRAANDDAAQREVESQMVASGHQAILNEVLSEGGADRTQPRKGRTANPKRDEKSEDVEMSGTESSKSRQPKNVINLDDLVFEQGNHLMTNATVNLPTGSTKTKYKGYEEIKIPAPRSIQATGKVKRMPTSELPDWAQTGFGSAKELNPIQTACFPSAFHDDGNMLVCAPTGSGKTNVAMLTMLREIGKHRDPHTGRIRADQFKMVYISPLKALVTEQVGNFSARLGKYGLKVCELTGDSQATKSMIQESSLIVVTPEKWDVVTRKATDVSYTSLVTLIIIDEIHLLHDDRGWVLESIVSRFLRREAQTHNHVRIVGLSATLPNYGDVAAFLQVDKEKSMFHFDGSYRPCPLQQEFIGVTERKRIKQLRTMNDICYTKVMEQVGQKHNQMLIFTHSRKDTGMTAKAIRDKALEENTMDQILRGDAAVREILRSEVDSMGDANLRDVLPYGFGIHHAGMSRNDRLAVEDLFRDGHIQVLVCTATLAWGVNLPAHTVIIKGTSVYLPKKGSWGELSPQDVLQMLGRAGRPQYDTYGEGIIITTSSEMQYYISLMNQQLPIESQLAPRLTDALNAEIVLGNIRNRDEAVDWLSYTYFFIRMLRSPGLYQVGAEYAHESELDQKRIDLVHSAAILLAKADLLRYDPKSGAFKGTDLGRIASHYYLRYSSLKSINDQLDEEMDDIRFMRLFSTSDEFKEIPVRPDEKLEVAKLLGLVPIPIAETADEPAAKINCLLQAWISRIPLEGFTMVSDMGNISSSAARLWRAIFEICLNRGYAQPVTKALDYCKTCEGRMWTMFSPLRQFPTSDPAGFPRGSVPLISEDIVQKADRIGVKWKQYLNLDAPRLGELLGMPRKGKDVFKAIEHFPRLKVDTAVRPVTQSLLQFDLTITPEFKWNDYLHGSSLAFWIFVEDVDVLLLHHEYFVLRKEYVDPEPKEHFLSFTVPVIEPIAPFYFLHVEADRWVGSTSRTEIGIRDDIKLPEKFAAPTTLLDLQPVPASALGHEDFQSLFKGFRKFNKIQTQVFNSLFATDDNVLVGAPVGSGKTVCAEFAILRHFGKGNDAGPAAYVTPLQELVDIQYAHWKDRLGSVGGGKNVVKFTGETSADLKLLGEADLVLATPPQWDTVSRLSKNRKVRSLGLFVADELHMIGDLGGPVYETIVSRMHAMSMNDPNSRLRLVGLSVPVASARDMGAWMGATKHNIFNFAPSSRPMPLELRIQSFTNPHFPSLMSAMARPVFYSVTDLSPDKRAMIFVSDFQQIRNTAKDLIMAAKSSSQTGRFFNGDLKEMHAVLDRVSETALAASLTEGIAYFHEGLNAFDKRVAQYMFDQGVAQVMLVSHKCCYEINMSAHLVIIMGTQYYDGFEHRYIDYTIGQILQMFGLAGRQGVDRLGKGVLMAPANKRDYFKKFLEEPLPVESHLHESLADAFIPDIVSRRIATIESALDWFTFTYFYQRLLANPSFYGLRETTHDAVSTYVTDLAMDTLNELAEGKLIELDEDEDTVEPKDAARIANFYDISQITVQTFLMSLSSKTNMKALLNIVSEASEFEKIPIRKHEQSILQDLYSKMKFKLDEVQWDSPTFKAFILLQAQFSRLDMYPDLLEDQKYVLLLAPRLLNACADILSSRGHLNVTLPMEMCQMTIQAMWDQDSQLLQLPHFGPEQVQIARDFGVRDVISFITAMDPEEFEDSAKLLKRLGFRNSELQDISNFTNNQWPDFETSLEVVDPESATVGQPVSVNITVQRTDMDDMDVVSTLGKNVHAPYYPGNRTEGCLIFIGDESHRELLEIKRLPFGREIKTKLMFVPVREGLHDLALYIMHDSYVGVDEVKQFRLNVAPGDDDEEEEEQEESGGEE